MRAKDFLFESPFLEPGQMLPPATMKGPYPSTENLNREFEFLGSLLVGDYNYNFWINNTRTRAIVTTVSDDHELNTSDERQLLCCDLKFYEKIKLPVQNQLQVSRVYTHPQHRANWLDGALYIVLVRYGFTIVSDLYQYAPGKGLWKSLARDSNIRDYRVFIWDQRTRDWIRDPNGLPVQYDTSNIYDITIWHNVNSQQTCLLVLTKEQKIE